MMTSCTSSAGTLERFSASRMATAPSSGALRVESAPRNLPMGVRAAPTMTGVRDLSGIVMVVVRCSSFNATRNLTTRGRLLYQLRLAVGLHGNHRGYMRAGLAAGLMGIGGIFVSFGAVVAIIEFFSRHNDWRLQLPTMTS